MNEIMQIATLQMVERNTQIQRNQQETELLAMQIEHTRFMTAFKVRRLVNRLAPTLAPHLGF